METTTTSPSPAASLSFSASSTGIRVPVGDRQLAGAVEPLGGGVDAAAGGRIGNCFHADGDLHARETLSTARVGIGGTRGYRVAMRRLLPLLGVLALACVCASATHAARGGVPPLLFPVVGTVNYEDDFGDPRGALQHQGNDLLGDKRAPVVAVEDGTVKYWTTSSSAGCMLYLYGAAGRCTSTST